ncbi:MAG: hypothetical protein ACKVUS_06610, partial [Saprospiraceae bacterium]
YGAERLAPGGDLHNVFEKFCAWASTYDTNSENIRSRACELEWLENLLCPVLKIEVEKPVDELADTIEATLFKKVPLPVPRT